MSLLPSTQQRECKKVGSPRSGNRTGILNNYSWGLQGGWRLISCISTASMPAAATLALSPEGAAHNYSHNTHRGWPCTSKGKASCLMFCPLLGELLAERGKKVFLLLLQQIRKEDRVCWRLCSSRRLREEFYVFLPTWW